MSTASTPIPPVLSERNKFRDLARASWIAPLIGFALNLIMIGAQVPPTSVLKFVGPAFYILGLLFGLIALFGVSKYGKKGILGQALCGMCVNGLIIAVVTIGVFAAK